MKKLSDYNFCNSWQINETGMQPLADYVVLKDLRQLKQGTQVKFIGFDDVDNHYGVFVFVDAEDNILEVGGDFSGPDSLRKLKASLAKV